MTTPFIRPDVRTLLGLVEAVSAPPLETLAPDEVREAMAKTRGASELPVGELAVMRDFSMPGPAGPIGLRLFDARAERAASEVIVFYHGGGFVLGDLDSHASLCAELARTLDLPLVSVDYRLAPEAPFPAGPDDAIAAARWVAGNGEVLGRQATGLVLMGDSAGANLATVAAVALRDAPATVPVAALGLIYPVTETCRDEGSGRTFGEGYMLTRALMDWFDRHYAATEGDWRRTPLLAGAEGMPPTLVMTAGLDPLRDQGRVLAAALAEAGVDTIYLEAAGTVHGFMTMRQLLPSARDDLARFCAALKLLLGRAA